MSRLLRWLFTNPSKNRWKPYIRAADDGKYEFKGVEVGVKRGFKRLKVAQFTLENNTYHGKDTEWFTDQLLQAENEAREKATYLNAVERGF